MWTDVFKLLPPFLILQRHWKLRAIFQKLAAKWPKLASVGRVQIQPLEKRLTALAWSVADSEASLDEVQRLVGVDADNAILLTYLFVTAAPPANATPPPLAINVLPSPTMGNDARPAGLTATTPSPAASIRPSYKAALEPPSIKCGDGLEANGVQPNCTQEPRAVSWLHTNSAESPPVSPLLSPPDTLVPTAVCGDTDTVGENTCMGLLAVLGKTSAVVPDPVGPATGGATTTTRQDGSTIATKESRCRPAQYGLDGKQPRAKKRIAPVLIRAPPSDE